MVQSQTPYQVPNRQPNTANRGNQRGRGGRGGAPRRAAAETEHTVVRGRTYGKQISTTVVHHQTDIPESSCRNDMDVELLGDPPDIPRGAASKSFKRTLSYFCRKFHPDVVCLFEPKVSGTHANRICSSFGFEDWIRVEAVGFSGGIWVKDGLSSPWVFSAVYGSPNLPLRKKLFTDLSANISDPHSCWLICGDFNSVTNRDEVSNTESFMSSRCADFVDWISREGLIDLGFEGPKFTWTRGKNTTSYKAARLDRALCNGEWKLRFPNAKVEHLPRLNSDHIPLLISCNPATTSYECKKFIFNFAWTIHKDFRSCVRDSWLPNRDLEDNKTAMAVALIEWNKRSFGNIFQRKKRLMARLKGIQTHLSLHVRQDLINLEKKLSKELEITLHQEELVWFQ
ncbi:uncharacterized protein LOC116002705 [Ipomoea triloba]|uniref:uncharacterized protein LOC116002705 n=1 Tax=Ipomoea triloba TaxID=35885 RepID=UPI00125E7F69|nr:uncharacterized protein LOC116002705 [Ipomoea triloba]